MSEKTSSCERFKQDLDLMLGGSFPDPQASPPEENQQDCVTDTSETKDATEQDDK